MGRIARSERLRLVCMLSLKVAWVGGMFWAGALPYTEPLALPALQCQEEACDTCLNKQMVTRMVNSRICLWGSFILPRNAFLASTLPSSCRMTFLHHALLLAFCKHVNQEECPATPCHLWVGEHFGKAGYNRTGHCSFCLQESACRGNGNASCPQ